MQNTIIIFVANYFYLFVAAASVIYFFTLNKDKQKSFALLTIIALPAIYATSKLAAFFYFDPRPFVIGHFVPLIPHAPDNGFPSDHALLTGAIASLVFPFSKKLSLVLWLLALAIGVARVMAGIHHTADILGGMIIAAAATFAVNLALKRQKILAYPRS